MDHTQRNFKAPSNSLMCFGYYSPEHRLHSPTGPSSRPSQIEAEPLFTQTDNVA